VWIAAYYGVTVSVAVLFVPPKLAVTVRTVFALTAAWLTLKVAATFPAATVTVRGTEAADGLELATETVNPPAGAALVKETVPVTEVVELPFTEAGETETEARPGGRTVKVAVCSTFPAEAVIVTDCDDATADVFTVNVAVVAPAETFTEAGSETIEEFELLRLTAKPPTGASPERVTVPVTLVEDPPTAELGVTDTL